MKKVERLNYTDSLKLFFKNTFNFKGSMRRSDYWRAELTIIFLYCIFILLSVITYGFVDSISGALAIVAILIVALTFIPRVSATIRRLHDTNHSGVLILFALLGPFALILLVLLCRDSYEGKNSFGDNPKGINNDNNVNEDSEYISNIKYLYEKLKTNSNSLEKEELVELIDDFKSRASLAVSKGHAGEYKITFTSDKKIFNGVLIMNEEEKHITIFRVLEQGGKCFETTIDSKTEIYTVNCKANRIIRKRV